MWQIITFLTSESQTFQGTTKDEKWIEIMDEEIKMMEKTTRDNWWISLKIKKSLDVTGSTKSSPMRMTRFRSTKPI